MLLKTKPIKLILKRCSKYRLKTVLMSMENHIAIQDE